MSALDDWFDHSHPRVKALQSTLHELASKDINPKLPDISQSLQLLKARLAGRSERQRRRQTEDDADAGKNGESGGNARRRAPPIGWSGTMRRLLALILDRSAAGRAAQPGPEL